MRFPELTIADWGSLLVSMEQEVRIMKRNIVQRYFIREVYEKSPKYRIFLTIILYFLQSFSNILDTHEVSKKFPCIQLGKRWTLKEKKLCLNSSLSLSPKPSPRHSSSSDWKSVHPNQISSWWYLNRPTLRRTSWKRKKLWHTLVRALRSRSKPVPWSKFRNEFFRISQPPSRRTSCVSTISPGLIPVGVLASDRFARLVNETRVLWASCFFLPPSDPLCGSFSCSFFEKDILTIYYIHYSCIIMNYI